MRVKLLICSLLFAVTLGVYWPIHNHGFIYYDDPQFITENEEVKAGLTAHGFHYAFTSPVVGNWHPLTTLSHMLDCQLFGVNAGAHHLMNAFIHAVNAVLLFLVLSQMTEAMWRSAVVAAVFAVHPLRVESVAWISERKDVLCWFFGLLALLAYIRHARHAIAILHSPSSILGAFKSPAYWLAIVFFACALMSKAMLVTFPFLLLLLDFWPLHRITKPSSIFHLPSSKWLLVEKLPFLILSAACCFITLQVQKSAGAMAVIKYVSASDRLANAVMSYAKYLGKTFWPSDLAVVYPHPSAPYASAEMWSGWQIGLTGLVILGVSIFCLQQIVRRPYLAVGWFWYLGTLVPVIGLVQVGEQAMADRYTYIPLVGPAITLVWVLSELVERLRLPRQLQGSLILLLVGILITTTRTQLQFWRNTVTLFTHNIQVTPANPSAHFALGVGWEKEGQVPRAMDCYRQAIELDPRYKKAHYNMGQLFRKQGQWLEAASSYRAALESDPNDVPSLLNLAGVLNGGGQVREAVLVFEQVLRLDSDSVEALNNLAWIYATNPDGAFRDGARAIAYGERACELSRYQLPTVVGTLAAAYAEAGRFTDAITAAERAIELARAAGQTDLATRNAELLHLYRASKPYRETASDGATTANHP